MGPSAAHAVKLQLDLTDAALHHIIFTSGHRVDTTTYPTPLNIGCASTTSFMLSANRFGGMLCCP